MWVVEGLHVGGGLGFHRRLACAYRVRGRCLHWMRRLLIQRMDGGWVSRSPGCGGRLGCGWCRGERWSRIDRRTRAARSILSLGVLALGHFQYGLSIVTQIDRRKMWILQTPLRQMLLVDAIAVGEAFVAEVNKNVRAGRGHKRAHILRLGDIHFAELLRDFGRTTEGMRAGFGRCGWRAVEFGHKFFVKLHAVGTGLRRVAGVDADDDGKRVVPGREHGRRHGEDDAVRVDQADRAAFAHEGSGHALHDGDPQLVGQQAHDGGALHPRELLQFGTPRGKRNSEKIVAEVGTKDAEQVGVGDLAVAEDLDRRGAIDAKTRVVQEKAADQQEGRGEDAKDGEERQRDADAAPLGGEHRLAACTARDRDPAPAARRAGFYFVFVVIVWVEAVGLLVFEPIRQHGGTGAARARAGDGIGKVGCRGGRAPGAGWGIHRRTLRGTTRRSRAGEAFGTVCVVEFLVVNKRGEPVIDGSDFSHGPSKVAGIARFTIARLADGFVRGMGWEGKGIRDGTREAS